MKKKILLRTLILLTTVGVSLGASLPLASCSCNNANNDIMWLNNKQEALDFIYMTCNDALSGADADKDWSASSVDNQTMIDWFNDKITAQVYAAMVEWDAVVNKTPLYPIKYSYINDVATYSQTLGGNMSYELCISKSNNLFRVEAIINGTSNLADAVLTKMGISSNTRIVVTNPDWCKIVIRDNAIWPNVKFPTAGPILRQCT